MDRASAKDSKSGGGWGGGLQIKWDSQVFWREETRIVKCQQRSQMIPLAMRE